MMIRDDGPTDGNEFWIDQAACGDADLGTFFPTIGASRTAAQALLACELCPVRAECAAHALAFPHIFRTSGSGVVAGTTGAMRRKAGDKGGLAELLAAAVDSPASVMPAGLKKAVVREVNRVLAAQVRDEAGEDLV